MAGSWDAIVIGGGPAGCAFAGRLSDAGRRVLLLDRDRFPRYHEGESLSPGCWRTFDALGLSAAVREAGFVVKRGATFVWGGGEPWTIYYDADGDRASLQVGRDRFDQLLLDQVAVRGVQVRQGCDVRDVVCQADRAVGVGYLTDGGSPRVEHGSWIVDASGRDTLLARQFGLRRVHPDLANTAVWGYWEGCHRLDGRDRGNSVFVSEHDWCFWYTPLDDGTDLACVGIVVFPSAEGVPDGAAEPFYLDAIRDCDVLSGLLMHARQVGPVRVAPAPAYRAARMAGPGWLLLGDAACWVDPILSAGVQSAFDHAGLATTVVAAALDEPDLGPPATALYDTLYRRYYDTFTELCLNLYRAAAPRSPMAPVPRLSTGGADPTAFLSLVSGLPAHDLPGHLGAYFAGRAAAAARGGRRPVPGEEEGFAFLTRHFHQRRLRAERSGRPAGPLRPDSVLRLAPGARVGMQVFVPHGEVHTLIRQRAVVNRYGDRFEASPAMRALFGLLATERSYEDVRRGLRARMRSGGRTGDTDHTVDDTADDTAFGGWIELLADQALVEWSTPCGG